MTEPYLGQILPFGFAFAPRNWATCSGQILAISQNTALYSLLGTYYGGNGQSNFGLPNLLNSVAIGAGQGTGLSNYVLGETGGTAGVSLLTSEIASHTHALTATTSGAQTFTAAGNQLATGGGGKGGGGKGGGDQALIYSPNASKATTGLSNSAILPMGRGISHNNMQPYLGVNFCICLSGNYPPRG